VTDASPSLAELGWDDRLTALFAPFADAGQRPARVTRADRSAVSLLTADGPLRAHYGADLGEDPPVVGDWVSLEMSPDGPETVAAVLPRRSALVRGATGASTGAQVLAANVDRVLILVGLDNEPNQRRLERALTIAWSSGAVPAVIATVHRSYDPGLRPPTNADAKERCGCFSLVRAIVCSQLPNSPCDPPLPPPEE